MTDPGYCLMRSEVYGEFVVIWRRDALDAARREGVPTYAPSEIRALGKVKQHPPMLAAVVAVKRVMRTAGKDARICALKEA